MQQELEEQANQEAENMLSSLKRVHQSKPTARLRDLLNRLDAVIIQEALLNNVRLQKQDNTDAWHAGTGYYNFVVNNRLWRLMRAHGYELMREFKEATTEAFGKLEVEENDADSVNHKSLSLRTDFDPVREVYLVFPADVVGEGCNYSHLADFYIRLLKVIPADLDVVLFVKSREHAKRLRSQKVRERIRYVVHSELESIWLRDYAGFNRGVRLVKPIFSPKRLGDNMKLLHSLLEVDLAPLDLVWDGGNLVTNGSKGFISTRLFKHNPKKSPDDILRIIRSELGISPVWVELPEQDKLAHTDGYITFISPNQALVSTYPPAWGRLFPEDQRCVDALARQVEQMGIKVERVMEYPEPGVGKSGVDSAEGIYVNLLQLNGTWLVPTYGRLGEDELLAQLQRLNPHGSVVPLDCTQLAKMGGVLHCITFCN
jgi:agmatine deiminase